MATRAGMIALMGLFALGIGGRVTAASRQDSLVLDLLARRTQERIALGIASKMPVAAFELKKFAGQPPCESGSRRWNTLFWHGCGFGVAHFSAAPRTTRLPVDPLLILGEGYLKCQSVTAMRFEPTVSVEPYPPGYFGEYEYEGLLASDRCEFSDEASLEKIFRLLVEGVRTPNADEMIEEFLDDETEPELKLADYRKSTGFFPELLCEFVGEKPLRVEINLTTGRMLILAGEKWEGYEIDSRSAWVLRTWLWAERTKQEGNR